MYLDTVNGPVKVESVKVMMLENEEDEHFLVTTLENGIVETLPISYQVAEILIGNGMGIFGSDGLDPDVALDCFRKYFS